MNRIGFGSALLGRMKGEVVEGRSGQRISGRLLQDAVASCALGFRGAGNPINSPILLALDLSLESVLAYLGALASGRVFVPIDAKEWREKGQELLDILRPAACWFPSHMTRVQKPTSCRVLVGIDRTPPDMPGESAAKLMGDAIDLEDRSSKIRVLMPTSGSTGKPSLVSVTDANLFANTTDIVDSQSLTADDKALLCLPLNYCFGASVLHSHLWVGGSVVVDERTMFPEKVLNVIESERCTTFAGVPTSFLFLQSRSSVLQRQFSNLRLWLQAGGYLSESVVHSFRKAHPNASFIVMYGQTEATARIASFVVGGDYPHGCVGYPMSSLELEIRGENGAVIGPEKEGDIWIRGASVCAGYYGGSKREANKFIDGWLNTGDIGYKLKDGRLCITGRSDGFIKIRGRRVSSVEIEEIIWRAFALRSCACAIPDPASGEVIGLLLEQHDSLSVDSRCSSLPAAVDTGNVGVASMSEPEFARRVRSALPQHWDLGPVVSGELPLTSSGKINRNACLMTLKKAGGNRC